MSQATEHPANPTRQTQKCGATAGPSAREWEENRAAITELYAKMRWEDMDKVMREKYDFHASKRMYNQRFRTWGIQKYLKTSDKRQLLQEAGGGSLKRLGELSRQGKVDAGKYKKTLRWHRSVHPSPSRPLEVDDATCQLEYILKSLRDYHHWVAEPGNADASRILVTDLEPSRESSNLWYGISLGVTHLVEAEQSVERSDRAFSMLRQVGFVAAPAMLARPLDFIGDLFVEMTSPKSPSWSEPRRLILRLFNQEAIRVFSTEHPIAIICREMQKTENLQEVANRSLDCMSDLVTKLWGEHHVLSFKVRTANFMLALKSSELVAAERMARQLLAMSQEIWGPASQQVRLAKKRLGHVYFAVNEKAFKINGPDIKAAQNGLNLFHEVLSHPVGRNDVSATGYSEDDTTLSTMGDIAWIHHRLAQHGQVLYWYERAIGLAKRLHGPGAVVTTYVGNKLVSKLKEMGRHEDAKLWEASISQYEQTR
ncbi:hypothetical protein JX265_013629 [Neoarthrinium moseri]|uniref:Clr5 domain-containing protein n=1 Tax=Neoarthrinium moseri TaxID=1658444 RepID=A0A9Q0AII7_9PEZI|nr:uncharacterized protein JN550_002884 [Neoarthrinium moseri]KAI1842105.1 hypothetical protein JX266_011756 [Neoarthrinium moseri]KAI1849514.1 hypothetical protein JX265_013629 [Neoarthrinium moseri]KAI1874305.1 hypothetical protein JN550_002884 [Neoarthrinium moseri]